MDIKPPIRRAKVAPPSARGQASVSQALPAPRPQGELPEGGHEPLLQAKTLGRRSRKKWWILGAVIALVVMLAVAAGGSLLWYNDALQAPSTTASRIRVAITQGSTPDDIAKLLQEKGVIKNSFAFQLLMRQNGDRDKLQAGAYLFSPTQTAREVLAMLVDGKVDTFNVTILPGKTLADIKTKLIADGFAAADIDAAYAKKYSHPLLADKPDGVNLEGYVYPETYQVTSETTAEQLLVRTFDEFYKQIQAKKLQPQLAAHGLNLHQGITLASIVQMEVSRDADRRQAAQVFERRLGLGMELGSDVTYMYAAKLTGQTPSPSLDSPYNTRLNKGLPPGAIANFTLSSLQAVADPASGDYLYFVAGDDGTTHFARTEAEHEANVKQYCTKLCNE